MLHAPIRKKPAHCLHRPNNPNRRTILHPLRSTEGEPDN
jgi:hypothetical protein